MASTKTDNHDPTAKLELRRYFLRKYHGAGDPPNVLDCCQGSGLIWNTLRKEFDLAGYWGLDVKPKPGRLKLDSVRVLQQAGWPQNVVDIDTYGSPWKHWLGMQLAITKPITVFLTIGKVILAAGGRSLSKQEMIALGMTFKNLPSGFGPKLGGIATSYLLPACCDYGKMIIEAVEAVSDGNARYIGVRVEPCKKATSRTSLPSGRSKQSRAERSNEHV